MRGRTITVALAALAAAAGGAAAAPGGGRITVGRAATVVGDTVTVGDLATLEGGATAFGAVELGPAPAPGASRRLDGRTILRRLREAGLDAERTRYVIPTSVQVERAAQEIGVAELGALVEEAAAEVLEPGVRLRALDVAGPVRIPLGAYETMVSARPATGEGGRRRFDVAIVQDGRVVITVPVRADLDVVGPVVVVRRPIARGATVRAEDLAVEERELGGSRGRYVQDLAEAVGMQARIALAAGTPLGFRALERPLLVQRGDLVTVVVETRGMRLSVPGEARESGAAGTAIRVLNRKSQQELSGQVVAHGVVLVQY